MVWSHITALRGAAGVRFAVFTSSLIAGCGQLIGADFEQRGEGCRDAASGRLRGNCASTGGSAAGGVVDGAEHAGAPTAGQASDNDGGAASLEHAGSTGAGGVPASHDAGAGGLGPAAAAGGEAGAASANPPVWAPSAFEGPTWPGKLVRVCWRDQLERPDIATRVELLVRSTWGRSSGLRFVTWTYCPMDVSGWLSVALDTGNEGDVDGIGSASAERRISLGIHMAQFDAAVVHLFGHALGFSHGERGPNNDVGAGDCDHSDVGLGPSGYWQRSVMNPRGYCGPAELGPRDVVMLQTAYGRKGSGALVSLGNRCVDIPGEVAKQWQLLQIYECNFARNQSWYRDTDAHLFAAYAPGLAFDIAVGAQLRYLQLYARSQPPTTNQQFALADGQLRAVGDSCVDATGTGSVQAGPCTNATLEIRSDGRILIDDGCLTGPPLDGPPNDASPSLAPCDQGPRQVFAFSRTGQLRQSDACLEVVDAGDPDASRSVRFASCRAEADPLLLSQQFYFRGRVLSGGECLHVVGETALENAGLETVGCAPYDPSQWWEYYFTDPL